MPSLPPVIDSHVHMWDVRRTPREATTYVKLFGWNARFSRWLAYRIFPQVAVDFFGKPDYILADYLPPQLQADAAHSPLTGFVHVEAGWRAKSPMDSVNETRWLEEVGGDSLLGIVGFADLAGGMAVEEVLRAHLDASDRFCGIRYALAHHDDPSVLDSCSQASLATNSQFLAGLECMAKRGLVFDATVYDHQLGEVAMLAERFPEMRIVLDHAGTPVAFGGAYGGQGQDEEQRRKIGERWRDGMRRLAELENVYVKISGLTMPVVGWGVHSQDPTVTQAGLVAALEPMVRFIIEQFGADRCMFASNFPIDKVSVSWRQLFDAFATIVDDYPESDRAALFSSTAKTVYRI